MDGELIKLVIEKKGLLFTERGLLGHFVVFVKLTNVGKDFEGSLSDQKNYFENDCTKKLDWTWLVQLFEKRNLSY